MLNTRKKTHQYDSLAEQVINYAKKSGYQDIKADFPSYDKPASLTMLNNDITLTPDFTARRGESKFYFELGVKQDSEDEQNRLVSKWKVLESIAGRKGGKLMIFAPRGSYNYAHQLIQEHDIDASVTRMNNL